MSKLPKSLDPSATTEMSSTSTKQVTIEISKQEDITWEVLKQVPNL